VRGVEGEEAALGHGAEDAFERGVEDAAVVGLARAQCLLGALELGDVDTQPDRLAARADRFEHAHHGPALARTTMPSQGRPMRRAWRRAVSQR